MAYLHKITDATIVIGDFKIQPQNVKKIGSLLFAMVAEMVLIGNQLLETIAMCAMSKHKM